MAFFLRFITDPDRINDDALLITAETPWIRPERRKKIRRFVKALFSFRFDCFGWEKGRGEIGRFNTHNHLRDWY
uniref:Uncharacterized protein n=1 Tax=Cucumis sativus TaxID=3659 RepID=A0A0A0K261_CUCSA